jgi:hypothetical protein
MTNKSLVYFLCLVVALLAYSLYKSEEESRRLFKIAEDLQGQMHEQNLLIRKQQLFLEYFHNKNSLKPQASPLYGPL